MKNDLTYQSEFDKFVQQWKNMDQSTDAERKKVSSFYDEKVFPVVKEVFVNKNRPDKQYDGLILTVGFSHEPLILSILAINPKRIGLLYTRETASITERIQSKTGYSSARTDLLPIDGTDVKGIYDKTWQFARNTWGDFENVAVDITGGRASMVSGVALAATIIPADICYVDTDNYLSDLRMPEPGSEYLRFLKNPDTLLRTAR